VHICYFVSAHSFALPAARGMREQVYERTHLFARVYISLCVSAYFGVYVFMYGVRWFVLRSVCVYTYTYTYV